MDSLPDNPPRWSGLQTRLLWPFVIDAEKETRLNDILKSFGLKQTGGATYAVWEQFELPESYRDELLPAAIDAVCATSHDKGASGYWRVPNSISQKWFKDAILCKADLRQRPRTDKNASGAAIIQLDKTFTERIDLTVANGIELFVNGLGIGVLSVGIQLTSDRITEKLATEFNYLATRNHAHRPAGCIHLEHPNEDSARWAKIPEEARQHIVLPPAEDAPIIEQISRPGGWYSFRELAETLLEPMHRLGYRPLRDSFLVYTVAHGTASIDLQDPSEIRRVGPFLSGLAQVEEAIHAGAPDGPPNMAQELLNRCHWAAVGMLGAAHVIVDQVSPPGHDEHPFNVQRPGRVRDKYFIPYLVGLMQRCKLQAVAEQAVPLADLDGDALRKALSAVRTDLLRFGVRGNPTQTSTRETLHHFYLLSRKGLDIENAWSELRATLADFDSKLSEEQQIVSATTTNATLARMADIQANAEEIGIRIDHTLKEIESLHHVAHRLEVFLVAVYAAHLWHMVAHGNEKWFGHLHATILPWGVLIFATLGGLAAYGFQVWAHRRTGKTHGGKDSVRSQGF